MVGERPGSGTKGRSSEQRSRVCGCVFVASAAHLHAGQTKLPSIHRL